MDGQGTTVTFGTTSHTFLVISVGEVGKEGEEIETTHLGTTGGKTYIAATLYDGGETTLTVEHNNANKVTVPGPVETVAYNFGGENKPVETSGFIKSYKVNGAETGQRVTASLVIKHTATLTQSTTTSA